VSQQEVILVVGLALLGVVVLSFTLRAGLNSIRRSTLEQLLLLQNQLLAGNQQATQQIESFRQTLQTVTGQINQTVEVGRRAIDNRLGNAQEAILRVSSQLGKLDASTQRMVEIGEDVQSLQNILRSPKLRGNLGELFLADLLAQILPPRHFQLQYTFKGGETVDAVVLLKAGMVPVDAKFPLENFQRLTQAPDTARRALRREFLRDVKKHVDAIADKYIRPDENTFPFALMYIPAENVYYEAILREEEDESGPSLFAYTLSRRVIPVSPNSFFAYLQTILLGLKGLKIEESAREILNHLDRLKQETEKFSEHFRLVGAHLDNARKKYDDADKQLGRVDEKLDVLLGLVKYEDRTGQPEQDSTEQD